MKKFREKSKLYRIDANGCIAVPDRPVFSGEWKEALDYIVQTSQSISDASLYVTGSVAEGTAVKDESDISICYVKDDSFNDNELPNNMLTLIDGYITTTYPFIKGVNFTKHSLDKLSENDHFLLKTFAQHLAGPDSLKKLSRPSINMHTEVGGMSIKHNLLFDNIMSFIENSEPEKYREGLKNYLRAFFVPIGKARGCYTRDLYHCKEMIGSAMPKLKYFLEKIENYILDEEYQPTVKELQVEIVTNTKGI